jgi:hypothetical protein
MIARPVADLVLVTARPTVTVGPIAVGFLQEFLVLALQIVLEDDPADLDVPMLISQARFLLTIRRIEIRVVVELACAANARMEHLGWLAVSFHRVVEQVSRLSRQGQSAFAVAEIDQLDESLIVKVLKSVVPNIEIVFRYDPKRADSGQRATVFAVEFVDSIPIDDQFPLVAARQVEVAHQTVAWIVLIPVARVVYARPVVAAIPRVEFARITPSSIGHRSLRC